VSEIKNIDYHHHVISIPIIIIPISSIRVADASELLTRHGTAMMIRWTVQQPEESTSEGEGENEKKS
jgi:hypothetical protein